MGITISTAFTTNSDATLTEFASSIASSISQVSTAVVTQIGGGTDNDRVITIGSTDEYAGNSLKMHSPAVTGGAGQVAVAIATTRNATAWTGLTHVNNQEADYIQIDCDASPGGEWIEILCDGQFWYAKITSISAEGVTPAG